MTDMKKQAVVVLPAYNEEGIIEKSVRRVHGFMTERMDRYDWKLVVADNNSTDGTADIVEHLGNELSGVELVRISQKGKARAVLGAWKQYDADIYCFMDADLATDIAALPKLFETLATGSADIACGSRYLLDSVVSRPFSRKIFSRGYRFVLWALLRLKTKDAPCGFKAINRRIRNEVVPMIRNRTWFFDSELVALSEHLGFRVREIPVHWEEKDEDKRDSKVQTFGLSVEYFKNVLELRGRIKRGRLTALEDLPEQPRSVIVLPTYNESDNLPVMLKKIFGLGIRGLHVLVVDDNSPDNTGQIAEDLMVTYPNLHVLHRKGKEGLGKAYIAGFERALDVGADLIFEMDADQSHDPRYIPDMLRTVHDCHLVLGSRYTKGGGVENWNFIRRLISRCGNIYARLVLRLPYKDLTGGYKCYRRSAISAIGLKNLSSVGYNFQIETTYRAHLAGMHILEVPIVFTERTLGTSKFDGRIIIEAFLKVLLLPWKK